MHEVVRLTVRGEPASKANSRRLVSFGGRPAFIKSRKALAYADAVALQVPVREPLLEGELRVEIDIYYASQRPDLDASVLLDALQGRVYANDRQVRELLLRHFIDKQNPRAEIVIHARR